MSPVSVLLDFRINVVSALICIQQVLPWTRNSKQGTFLLTGGGLALNPRPEYASLAMGKASLRNLCFSLAAELEPAGIHVATVTVTGFVQPGTYFDPALIAEKYWDLHSELVGAWEHKIVYRSK